MALKGISTGGGTFEPVSEGTHLARLVQLIDLGIQRNEYQGEVSEYPKLWLSFEIPNETVTIKDEEKPKVIGLEVTLSFGQKAKLPGFVKALDPGAELDEDYDLASILGKGTMINVGRTRTGKAKVVSAVPLPKGQAVEGSDVELLAFDFDNQDQEVLGKLPKFVQDKIANALNAKAAPKGSLPPIM